MGRPRSPNRDKAFELYKESGGRLTSAEIAAQLDEKISNINNWRVQDKWKDKVGKVGAPYENQNAIGNNGGAPLGNQNHFIHGLYSKYFPKTTIDIMKQVDGMDPIDILWQNICIKFAAIIRSQKIMYVKHKDELIKEIKKVKSFESDNVSSEEVEYEIQFAWDRQATFLNAQSKAMSQLTNMIRRYDEMLHNNWDLATEEQKVRIEKLKLQIQNPEFEYKKIHDKEKLELEKERLEHQKKMDELKNF